MTKIIRWHIVTYVDEKLLKKSIKGKPYKKGDWIGLPKIERKWEILNDEMTDIVPYIKFKYIGNTPYTGEGKIDMKEFNKLKKLHNSTKK